MIAPTLDLEGPETGSTTQATSYATASWTPLSNKLCLAFIRTWRADPVDTPTLTGNGLTWIQLGDVLISGARITVFCAFGTASSGAVTISYGGGVAQAGCSWALYQFGNTAGTAANNGTDAVAQTLSGTTTGTSLTINYSGFGKAANRGIAAFVNAGDIDHTPRSNWTELAEITPGWNFETQWRSDAIDTAASVTIGSSQVIGGIALELVSIPTFYTVMKNKNKTNQVGVFRATDPTSSWTYMAGVALSSNIRTVWVDQLGTDLHIVMQNEGMKPCYCKFDTTTDAFTISKEEINSSQSPGANANMGVSVGVRSGGDVVVIWTNSSDGLVNDIRISGTWNANGAITGTYNAGVVVKGISGRMHFLYSDAAADDLKHSSISTSNSFDTEATVDSSAGAVANWFPVKGVSFDSGGQTKVRVPYIDSGGVSVVEFDSAANPSFSITSLGVSQGTLPSYPPVCAAVDVSDVYVMRSDGALDVRYMKNVGDSVYGADIELHDAVTALAISANVYDRSGKKLAYLWDNNGTVVYNELSIEAAATSAEFVGWGVPI